jgi:hypothetical protein
MNNKALPTNLTHDVQWETMSAIDKQDAAVNLAIAALSNIGAAGRELDAWEALNFRSALGAIYTDFFSLSLNDIQLALTPSQERAPGWEKRFPEEIPTVDQFLRAFEQARYRPTSRS